MSKRACQLLLVCLTSATGLAATDPFVGTWKLNPSKSRVVDRMKIEAAGTGKFVFTFNADAVETIVADGTDQPANGGTTLAVTIASPGSWQVVRKRNGLVLLTARWTLSADGTTLTDSYTSARPDGSSSTTDFIYTRTTPGSSITGTWESMQTLSAFDLHVQPYGEDGLTFIYPGQRTRQLRFDGNEYPDSGPSVPAGIASSGRRVNERTLELVSTNNGKVTGMQELTVSLDLKVLTITARPTAASPPNVRVFDRK